MVSLISLVVVTAIAFSAQLSCAKVEFQDNFDGAKGPFNPSDSSSSYAFFTPSTTFTANDGVITQGQRSVEITADPYTLTVPQGSSGVLDDVKFLALQKTKWNLSSTSYAASSLSKFSLRFSAQTFNTTLQPFGNAVTNPQDDIRLASCGAINVDLDTYIVADFLATNTGLWALYERLPFGQNTSSLGNYLAFTSTKRVSSRRPDQSHDVRIEYNRAARTLQWFLNGVVVLTVDKIGLLADDPEVKLIVSYSGSPTIVDPVGFQTGFGCFSILQAADPYNVAASLGLSETTTPASAYVFPKDWVDKSDQQSSRLFGQGGQLTLERLAIELS